MSAFPRNQIGDLLGLRMGAEEFLSLGELPERYELHDGVVLMSPSPSKRHQLVFAELLTDLQIWRRARRGEALVVADCDLRLGTRRVYRPDIVVERAREGGEPFPIAAVPALAIEILSPGSVANDMVTKVRDYGEAGIEEYWVIDPERLEAHVWRRAGGTFEAVGTMTRVTSQAFPTLTINLGDYAPTA